MSALPGSLHEALDGGFAAIATVREAFTARLTPREVGTIISVATGIAKVSGLSSVGFEELVRFPGGVLGLAFNVDEDEVGVVLLGDYSLLHVGDEVERTGRVMDVGVGDGLLGRVIDALGRPLDGRGAVTSSERLPIERAAPAIMDRAPVTVPIQTGLKVIDALIPIGRGQRELILGDRQTGKSAIAIDTILNHSAERSKRPTRRYSRSHRSRHGGVGSAPSAIPEARELFSTAGAGGRQQLPVACMEARAPTGRRHARHIDPCQPLTGRYAKGELGSLEMERTAANRSAASRSTGMNPASGMKSCPP
jgi:hypothetical protein